MVILIIFHNGIEGDLLAQLGGNFQMGFFLIMIIIMEMIAIMIVIIYYMIMIIFVVKCSIGGG